MQKRIYSILLILFIMIFCGPVAGRTADEQRYVMRIGLGNPATPCNFGYTPFEVFKREAELQSHGRLQVELYPQMMGKSSLEMIVMVREGVVQARDFADGHLATVYPPLQVLTIPYLFAEREIAWEVLDGPFGRLLIEDMAKQTGLRPLYWIENGGFRHFSNNKHAIHSPADMKGLKIRTMESPLHIKIVNNLGAQGVPLYWGDVYEAIEAGIVDGQENSVSTFIVPHFENIQNHIVLDGHFYATYTLLMNDSWYSGLPPELKEVIERASRVSRQASRGLSVANEIAGLQYLESKGVQIYKPTDEEKQLFVEATRESAVAWLKENVGEQWVDGVLEATAAAEIKLGYRKP